MVRSIPAKQAARKADGRRFRRLGGALCLDFVNTVEGRSGGPSREYLDDPESLAGWCREAGLLSDGSPFSRKVGVEFLEETVAYRNRLYPWLAALARRVTPPAEVARRAEKATFALIARTSWSMEGERAVITWRGRSDDPAQIHWAIAWSAVDLVRGPDLDRLHECANPDCHWLFVDRTRNRSRRWCDMGSCGNLIKARRFYRRGKRAG